MEVVGNVPMQGSFLSMTDFCFLAFQSFQGSQGRAYLFNSV